MITFLAFRYKIFVKIWKSSKNVAFWHYKLHIYSLAFALFWVVVFSIIFFLTGSFVAALHTGPPPGLGFPCSTYWGRTFSQVGDIFLFWNVFGLLLLMVVPVQFLFESGKSIEKTKRLAYWSWVITIPIGFVLAVMPYVVQGAWVHGWGGGYVTMQCQSQIEKLHYAIVMYALDHDNHLPVAQNFAELYPQIESYLPESMRRSGWRGKYDVCVIGRAWDQTPKPFVWNSEFSGKEVFRNDDWQPYHSEIGNPIVSVEGGTVYVCGKPWVNCPYIHQDMVRPSGDIRNTEPEKLERLRHHRNLAQ